MIPRHPPFFLAPRRPGGFTADSEVMFIRVVLVTTFLAFMSASYAAPADSPLSPFDSLHLVFRARTPTFGVNLRRQTSDNGSVPLSAFPVQCQQGCAPAITAINTCTSSACICDPTVDSSLAYCISCSVNANPTTSIIQTGQQLVDTYNNLCNGTGVSTISFTITNTVSGTNTSATASTTTTTTTGNVTSTHALGPTTTISAPPQTGTSTITPIIITSTSATASSTSSTSNNAPVIRPRAALTSIGLAMALSITQLWLKPTMLLGIDWLSVIKQDVKSFGCIRWHLGEDFQLTPFACLGPFCTTKTHAGLEDDRSCLKEFVSLVSSLEGKRQRSPECYATLRFDVPTRPNSLQPPTSPPTPRSPDGRMRYPDGSYHGEDNDGMEDFARDVMVELMGNVVETLKMADNVKARGQGRRSTQSPPTIVLNEEPGDPRQVQASSESGMVQGRPALRERPQETIRKMEQTRSSHGRLLWLPSQDSAPSGR
ncbi:hypothetical protein JOM56_005309 [Amanita muscaria]